MNEVAIECYARLALKRLATITLGKMVQPEPAGPNDLEAPYLRAAHVQPDGRLIALDEKPMWFRRSEMIALDLRAGDVVVVEGGAGYGRSAVIRESMPGWGFQNSINRVRPLAERAEGRFLDYAVQDALRSGQVDVMVNTATIPHFTAEKLAELRVPAPERSVQVEIAELLDRETAQIDATVDAQQRLVDLLVERRNSVVLRSVMDRNDVTWRGPLGRVLAKLDRSVGDDSEVVTAYRDGVVVRRSERRDDGYTFSDLEQGYQGVMAGDLVFHGLDGFAGAVGVARSGGRCSPVYHVCTATARADNRYLGHVLRAYGHIGLLAAHAWSVRQRSVDYRNWKQLAALPIELPSHLDQMRTVESLETELAGIDRMSERVNASVALLRERRAALITAAVTGRIDPRTGVERLDDIVEGVAS